MLFLDFIKWWYGPGWVLRVKLLFAHEKNWLDYFSVNILLQTMFSPWRQNITSLGRDSSIQSKMSAAVDNLVSRLVGFTVRVFALFAAGVTAVVVLVFNLLLIVCWPLIPFLPIVILASGAAL